MSFHRNDSAPSAEAASRINLLDHRRSVHSQNGEDGIIEKIFEAIGERTRWCCEFGAWDGLHLSNTRHLIDHGWHAVLIEADAKRFQKLCQNNTGNDRVITVHSFVDTYEHRLDRILTDVGAEDLDLLVIDIDGLDLEILESLQVRPRVICVEVVGGHAPESRTRVPREVAAKGIGQPLGLFYDAATSRGYRLVSYYVNAFFVRDEDGGALPSLTPTEAYEAYLSALSPTDLRWLAYCNEGHVLGYRFDNERITPEALGLSRHRFPLRMWLYALIWHISRLRG